MIKEYYMGNKQSKLWDMKVSLEEIIECNPNCRLHENYQRHKSDDCYGRYIIFVKHPNVDTDERTIMIGIREDGFVYIGDINQEPQDLMIVETNKALTILEKWKNLLLAKDELERELIKVTDNDCLNIIARNNYQIEKSKCYLN